MGKFEKLKVTRPAKKTWLLEETKRKKKKKEVTLALKREVTAICRHFFIRDILQPLKVYQGSEIFRAMAALSTDVRKNDKSLKFPRFEYLFEYLVFFQIFSKKYLKIPPI